MHNGIDIDIDRDTGIDIAGECRSGVICPSLLQVKDTPR